MIKVESNMLVLDNSFSKEDVLAIDEFVQIAKEQERERIIKLLGVWWETDQELEELIDIIRGEK
jgi:uncharacterized protein (DUF934 family)